MRPSLANLIVLALLTCSSLLAQTSHRQLNPKPPRQPSVFEQLDKQKADSTKEQSAQQAAARRQRSASLAQLQGELPRLIELAQSLQEELRAGDLETALPADLEKQAKELEQVARRVHKRVRSL